MSKAGQSPFVPLLAGAILFLATLYGGEAALAQTREIEAVRSQVERLQREIQDLQRQTYRPGATPRAAAPAAGAATGAAARPSPVAPILTTSAQARIDQRLTELETELRSLRGTMERVSFSANRLSSRLDKLVADVDFRLRALESRTAPPPGAAATPQTMPTAAPLAAAVPTTATVPTPPPVSRQALAGTGTGSGVLGQLPAGALVSDGGAALETADTTAAPTEFVAPRDAGSVAAAQPAPVAGVRTRQAALVPPPAPIMPTISPGDAYRQAYSLLKRADFDGAERAFRGFLEIFPDHGLAENARYWLGETYYVRKQYRQAAIAFAEGYKQHSKGNKASDNLLKLAKSFGELEQKENACATLKRLRQEFPKARPAIKERAVEAARAYSCK